MTDTPQTVREDLAFMRAVAEHGARAPLLGGSILTLAGGAFGVAALAHWAVEAEVIALSANALWAIWGLATAVFYGGLWRLKRQVRARAGSTAPASRAFGAVWAGLGGALFTVFFGFAAASVQNGTPLPMNLFAVVVLAMYGTGWFVANAMTGRKWLFGVGLASFSAAFALALMAGQPAQMLLYAAALFGLVMVPGIVLTRTEPQEAV